MRYKAVIFDLDDTLVKTYVIKWAHHKAVAKRFYNIDLTDDVLAKHWGMPMEPMMAIFYQNSDTPENMMKANLSIEHEFLKEIHTDSLAVVTSLIEQNIQVGIITSTTEKVARADLEREGFPVKKLFIVQGGDSIPAHKPDPAVFAPAIRILANKGIEPAETLYVGDALMDYFAARDAGINFLGVTTGIIDHTAFAAEGENAFPTLTRLLQEIS